PLPNLSFCTMGVTPLLPQKLSIEPYSELKEPNKKEPAGGKKMHCSMKPSMTSQNSRHPRFESSLSSNASSPSSTPQRYKPSLTPMPSPLQPHCLAHDQMHLWLPPGESLWKVISSGNENNFIISNDQLNRILEVMGSSWA
ncbi:hypothetical protein DFJ58DRAFT_623890, partial [Suillus subalutaceus]|uniref:uncharacterized protein n=1 Tax=Suillus subalutaceus TaxID=48586 RepID=UPI001B863974